MTIKAIETRFQGYRFRSRLEARWAVFFDVVGIRWAYEIEGFDLGKTGYYLPDFWLPQLEVWVEIKPERVSETERLRCERLSDLAHCEVLLVSGDPYPERYDIEVFGPHIKSAYAEDGEYQHQFALWKNEPDHPNLVVIQQLESGRKCNLVVADPHVHDNEADYAFYWPSTHNYFAPGCYLTEAYNAARSARFSTSESPPLFTTKTTPTIYRSREISRVTRDEYERMYGTNATEWTADDDCGLWYWFALGSGCYTAAYNLGRTVKECLTRIDFLRDSGLWDGDTLKARHDALLRESA